MVLWKSRWSWVRLVKMPTAKWMPYTRSSTRAWEEASITTWVQPASRIRAKSSWSSRDSGVVRSVGITWSPIMSWLVPIRPTLAPASCSRMALSR